MQNNQYENNFSNIIDKLVTFEWLCKRYHKTHHITEIARAWQVETDVLEKEEYKIKF